MPDYWKNLAQVDPAALLRQVRREQAERNLPEFIRQAWPVIEPGTTFIDNWHIDCIGEYLAAVNRGQITRLIVNMPPRHMKSLEITVCYPAWTWVKHPERRFIKVSYSDSLSRKHKRMRHRGELGICVKRAWWGSGAAPALMDALLAFARENGFEQLNLEVRSDNIRAIRLYEKYGFRKLCVFPGFFKIDGKYIDFDLMALELTR